MKNTVKKFAAWLLTFMMLFSSMPTGSLAAVTTVRQPNEIIDVSDAVQVVGDLVTTRVTSRDGFSVVVSSPEKTLPKGGEVQFRTLRAVKAVSPVAPTGRRELGSYDISILDESYDICQRKVLCMRASNETKKIREEILSEVRTKLKDIEFDRD